MTRLMCFGSHFHDLNPVDSCYLFFPNPCLLMFWTHLCPLSELPKHTCGSGKAEELESKRDSEKQQAAQEAFDSFDTNDDGETSNMLYFLLHTLVHKQRRNTIVFPRAVCSVPCE